MSFEGEAQSTVTETPGPHLTARVSLCLITQVMERRKNPSLRYVCCAALLVERASKTAPRGLDEQPNSLFFEPPLILHALA